VNHLRYAEIDRLAVESRARFGDVLDSSRFSLSHRQALQRRGAERARYIVGEHGDSERRCGAARRSRTFPYTKGVPRHGKLTNSRPHRDFPERERRRETGHRGKGATKLRHRTLDREILESLLHDENRILPVSSLLTDYCEISDVCLSVPCIVNRAGIEQPLPVPMNATKTRNQKRRWQIKAAIKSVGF